MDVIKQEVEYFGTEARNELYFNSWWRIYWIQR